jgi:ribosomal protein S17E
MQKTNENVEEEIKLIEKMRRLDNKAARDAIAGLASENQKREQEHKKQEPQWEQMFKNASQAERESKNCEQAASKYFEAPPSPSEGLNKLCPTPAVLK